MKSYPTYASAAAMGASLALLLASCRGAPEPPAAPPNCATVSEAAVAHLFEQYPFRDLPSETQEKLKAALGTHGRVCLAAPAESIRCNAGDARQAEYRDCCHFTETPGLHLVGIPAALSLGGGDGPPVVDLRLEGRLLATITTSSCVVPTCRDDAAFAEAALEVSGTVRIGDEAVGLKLSLPLEQSLRLSCSLAS